jgi:hypothetical protein
MNNQAIAGQYHAALQMLRTVLETCPDDLWDASVGRHAFWLIGYHALYYTDLYLAGSLDAFTRPEFGRENEQYMEKLPHPPHEAIEIGEPYDRVDLLTWCDRCRKQVNDIVLAETTDSLAADVDLEWISFSRLELHFYNLRHLQHHVAQLSLELKFQTGTGVDWVGVAKKN